MKWAALLVLLLAVGAVTFFMLKKPENAPEPQVVAEEVEKPVAPEPAPAKVTASVAPVLNSSGTIDLVDDSGKTIKTISLKDGKKVGHLYDYVRADGKVVFLLATESSSDIYDLWVIDDSGMERKVNAHVIDAKISGDALKLAYITGNHTLIIEEFGGNQLGTAAGAFDLTWGNDQAAVFFTRVQDGVSIAYPDALELAKLDVTGKPADVVVSGLYDHIMPIMQPAGKFILIVAGRETGLPAFWKIEKGQTIQLTNVRLDETGAQWVPTPFSTAQWSEDGRWLIYDFKDGSTEQIWGLEFDDSGSVKRSVQITEGLVPRWVGKDKFVCLKAVNGIFESSVQSIPGAN